MNFDEHFFRLDNSNEPSNRISALFPPQLQELLQICSNSRKGEICLNPQIQIMRIYSVLRWNKSPREEQAKPQNQRQTFPSWPCVSLWARDPPTCFRFFLFLNENLISVLRKGKKQRENQKWSDYRQKLKNYRETRDREAMQIFRYFRRLRRRAGSSNVAPLERLLRFFQEKIIKSPSGTHCSESNCRSDFWRIAAKNV